MEPILTHEVATVLAVIAAVVILFITEWVRVDVVAIIVMVTLPLIGLLDSAHAFAGFSSNAVISIIAIIIIGKGLDTTGVMNNIAAPIIHHAGGSRPHLVALICGAVATVSSVMQNIGAAALFLPVTTRIGHRLKVPLSSLLMPMGFAAILGGTTTLIGCSPLIILNDLLKNSALPPFGVFSVTPIGLMLLASGIFYFLLLGPKLLPPERFKKEDSGPHLFGAYGTTGGLFEIEPLPAFPNDGKTLEELRMRRSFGVTAVAMFLPTSNRIEMAPVRSHRICQGDTLAVIGEENEVTAMASRLGFRVKPELELFAIDLAPEVAGLMEGIVAPQSELIGASLRENHFHSRFEMTPVGFYRSETKEKKNLNDIPVEPGDAILFFGEWRAFTELQLTSADFIFPAHPKHETFRHDKTAAALFSAALAIGLVVASDLFGLNLALASCLMTGALSMILLSVLSIDEAYHAVDWRTVFLLAGLIPLGVAAEESGAANYIAAITLGATGAVGPFALFAVIAILTTAFTLVISNVGATILLVPIAINMASAVGADPRLAALVVALCASNSFLLPTHQVNALLMGPGGYRTSDYLRVGGGMTAIFIVVTLVGIKLFY